MTDQARIHRANKELVGTLRRALYDWSGDQVESSIGAVFAPDAVMQLGHPFETMDGPLGWYAEALGPLGQAWPDLERRDMIVMAGHTSAGHDWVGCCGNYMGTSVGPWLGIPPTGRPVAMRFHEFFRVVEGRIVEMQALWDIAEVMMQSGVWPMGPSLGRDWTTPAPATMDGIVACPYDQERSAESLAIVQAMLGDMGRHPTEPVEAMNLERYWHPKFSWYGPAGIGTSRGIDGFRRHHQIPFLNAMPDRRGGYKGEGHFWADRDYVAVTAWPGMEMTLTGDGWLGIVPTGQAITMRSLDFWRVEGDLIRENWVMVDLLHVWNQLGVDVLARMAELAHRSTF